MTVLAFLAHIFKTGSTTLIVVPSRTVPRWVSEVQTRLEPDVVVSVQVLAYSDALKASGSPYQFDTVVYDGDGDRIEFAHPSLAPLLRIPARRRVLIAPFTGDVSQLMFVAQGTLSDPFHVEGFDRVDVVRHFTLSRSADGIRRPIALHDVECSMTRQQALKYDAVGMTSISSSMTDLQRLRCILEMRAACSLTQPDERRAPRTPLWFDIRRRLPRRLTSALACYDPLSHLSPSLVSAAAALERLSESRGPGCDLKAVSSRKLVSKSSPLEQAM